MASYNDFDKLDIRVGEIMTADDFPQARKPAYKLTIYFGDEIGTKLSTAQITDNYTKDDLVGQRVLGVVNLPPKQIGPFVSECLTLGLPDEDGKVVLVMPEREVPLGGRMF